MRSSSLARVVIASFGASVVITLGCDKSPGAPSPPAPFSVQSISPQGGPTDLATVAKITGTGFEAGDTVTVDGSRVDATVLSATTISVAMPPHAAGSVEVTVSRVLPSGGAHSTSVRGGYRYSVIPPPVIRELVPNTGSTAGGVPVVIKTPDGGGYPATVTVDGILTAFEQGFPDWENLYLTMPAHAAGTVDVILTDAYGRTGRGVFTYASPATFDFNGVWQAAARLVVEVPSDQGAWLELTVRDNTAISVSCSVCRPGETCGIGKAPSLTLDPPPVVADGEFSLAASGGVSITGKILSPIYATGTINTPSCGNRYWWAEKR
jgi:hypothetical protein